MSIECTRSAQGARSEICGDAARPSVIALATDLLPSGYCRDCLPCLLPFRPSAGRSLAPRTPEDDSRKAQGDPTIAQFPILVLVAAPTVIFSNLHT